MRELLLASMLVLVLHGCGESQGRVATTSPPKEVKQKPLPRVTDRPANEKGSVLIVEYHKFAKEEARWDRSILKFKSDLERLYKMGFRPVLLSEYLDDKMTLPPGTSPVIFTLDDSQVTQMRFLEDGTLDPDCGVAIWKEFASRHPDFPVKATFYLLPPAPFGQQRWVQEKLADLDEMGCEFGSHTLTHRALSKLPEAEAKKELEGSKAWIEGLGYQARSLALPYGIRPKNRSLLSVYDGVLLVGAGPAPSPKSDKFDPMSLPRIQAIEGDYGLTYWLDQIEAGKVEPYVAP